MYTYSDGILWSKAPLFPKVSGNDRHYGVSLHIRVAGEIHGIAVRSETVSALHLSHEYGVLRPFIPFVAGAVVAIHNDMVTRLGFIINRWIAEHPGN